VPEPDCRLGIDVGGTNTDAVIMDTADRVIAKAKVPTTADITGGIASAVDTVLAAPAVEPGRITHVMLGTTHATNAVLERRNLRRVAVLRLGGPATHSVRPMFGWPAELASTVSVGAAVVDGGIEFDGQDLSPLDTDAIARFLGQVGDQAQGIAITSVFAPVSARHELQAADVVKRELGDVHVSLSHEIGSIGLLERENATILNGALVGVANDVARAMRDALTEHGLQPVTFFAQNDGTLMSLDQALRYPVLTIGSGPANSVRGAAFLTGISDSLVVDVGGTSTDVGVLVNGFPRESSYGVEIGGIRTNFRMPDLVTIALGGGTVISGDPRGVRVGPRSVGYLLQRDALVFGGTTPTLTDSAVAAGRAGLASAAADAGERIGRHRPLLTEALAQADQMLADAIDRVKTSKEDRPLIAVGGGSILVPDRMPGVSEIIRPDHFDAANAVGAAIASVSGQVDRIFHPGAGGRQAILDEARDDARERAVAAGADPEAVQIIEIEEIPLAYLTSPAVRVRVKAAGALGGVPDHHLQARLAQQARLAGPVAGLDSKHHGGIHESPSRRVGGGQRRAGRVAGRMQRLGQHVISAAGHEPRVHLRHHGPGHGGRLGPGHRVLRRHHRDERDVRDAHPLQLRHQHRRAAARDQLVVR
jgi:N-methylhydantoinase A/oxoprolinase/acetone carboxylase beta subunit